MNKIEFQHTTGALTLIGVNGRIPENYGKEVLIEGKKYETEIVYDLPNHIAIKGTGDFVGKEIIFL